MEALKRANDIRSKRAQLKRDLKAGKVKIQTLLLDPPEYVQTAKVIDMLMAVPKYGRVKTNRILNQCRISPSKTIGGLSERQRSELVAAAPQVAPPQLSPPACRGLCAPISTARVLGPVSERGKVFVITGPSGVGKGTLIAKLLEARPGAGAVGLGDDARRRGPGRRTAATTTSSPRRSSSGGWTRTTSSSTRPTAATATGRCAPRSRTGSTQGHSVVLEIEVQGASQVRAAMPEAVQIFIAPAGPRGAPRAARGPRRPTPTEEIEKRLRTRRGRARGAGRVPARGRERRRAEGRPRELERLVPREEP